HRPDDRLFYLFDPPGIGQLRRAVDLGRLARGRGYAITNRRSRGDQLEIEFPFETLLNDLHVQKTKKSAAESKPQRRGSFGLVEKGRVIQTQLVQRVSQFFIAIGFDRVETGEDHWLDSLETRERGERLPCSFGYRVSDFNIADRLDLSGEEPDLARTELIDLARFWSQHAQRVDLVFLLGVHQPDSHAWPDYAVDNAHQHYNAAIAVKPG